MSKPNTGGAAFPRAAGDYNGTQHGNGAQTGMTMRDYFAAKALGGLIASRDARSPHFAPKDDAAYCYAIADAMLAERAQ